MTTISLNVNSVSVSVNLPVGATKRDMSRFPVPHDFILNGIPHAFKRFGCGELMIKAGGEVLTDFGMGYIEGHNGSNEYRVRIVDFDSEYSFTNKIGVKRKAKAMVSFLSDLHNRQVLQRSQWWAIDMDDKKTAEKVLEQMIGDDEYMQSFTAQSGYGGATEFAYHMVIIDEDSEPVKPVKKKRLKKSDDDFYIPSEIAAELDDEYGAFDDTNLDEEIPGANEPIF